MVKKTVVSLAFAFFFSCAGTEVNKNDPAALYKAAQQDIENDRYQLALEKLRLVKNKFPYSAYSTRAKLRIADVYFLQESYAQAASSYELFIELHPKNPRVPYAMYRLGLSHFRDSPDIIARDLTSATQAEEAFNRFIKRFPNHEKAEVAKKQLTSTRNLLAEKELYVGNFYSHWEPVESSLERYEKVVRLYPETEAANSARKKIRTLRAMIDAKDPNEIEYIQGVPKHRVYIDENKRRTN